jgi:hypothetical protein
MKTFTTGNNYQLMKLRRVIWAGHVESIGNENIVETFLVKTQAKRKNGRT